MPLDDGELLEKGLWALRREVVILLHAPAPDGWIAMAQQERQELTRELARIDALLTSLAAHASPHKIVSETGAREHASLEALRRDAEDTDHA